MFLLSLTQNFRGEQTEHHQYLPIDCQDGVSDLKLHNDTNAANLQISLV